MAISRKPLSAGCYWKKILKKIILAGSKKVEFWNFFPKNVYDCLEIKYYLRFWSTRLFGYKLSNKGQNKLFCCENAGFNKLHI